MGASQSFLSNAKYGYDFVVATTQASINATLMEYLSGFNSPMITQCYIYNISGSPVLMTLEQIQQQTQSDQYPQGVDPFAIPAGTAVSDPRVVALANINFAYGFQAQIGLPPGYPPTAIPDVIMLNPGAPGSVNYTLMCSTFNVVEITYDRLGAINWLFATQPSGNGWFFTSSVNLASLTVGSANYNQLPPGVRQAIDNLGTGAFSVQQLVYDFDNAELETMPTISGVPSGTPLLNCLGMVFTGAYFNQMKTAGQPVLGYTVSQNQAQSGSLVLTNMEMEASPFVDANGGPVNSPTLQQQQCQPLCYLCASDSDDLPPAVAFTWNWVELSEASQFDGVMAINRNTFAYFLASQIAEQIPAYCYQPSVHVYLSGFLDTTVNYQWSLAPSQNVTLQLQPTGPDVYSFNWSATSSDQAGLDGDLGQMRLTPSLAVTVTFQGNQIIIVQHLVIYLYISSQGDGDGGNVVDITITDTYTIAVGQEGALTATRDSSTSNNSQTPSTNGFLSFFNDLNSLISDVQSWASNLVSTDFTDLPLSVVQAFVFPGGSTFTFADVAFSDNQDLVSHITYVQPGQNSQVMAMRSPIRPTGVKPAPVE